MLTMSENIAELAEALAKAQGTIESAKKTSDNPFFKSKYADLSECWNACRKPLSENGLSIVQANGKLNNNQLKVTTVLLHTSGQWIKSVSTVVVGRMDIQGIGSAITYARRYSLAAMIGLTQEDDDGNAACNTSNKYYIREGAKILLRSQTGVLTSLEDLPITVLKQIVNKKCYENIKREIEQEISQKEAMEIYTTDEQKQG